MKEKKFPNNILNNLISLSSLSINILLLFIIIILLLPCIKANHIDVFNEVEFKNALQSSKNPYITIKSSFSLKEDYRNLSKYYNINEIIITGDSRNTILSLSDENNYILFKDYDKILLTNITFKGNVFFDNCNKVEISNLNWNGVIKSMNTNNQEVILKDMLYTNYQNLTELNGIYLNGGKYTLDNSTFIGSKSIEENIIYISGSGDVLAQLNIKNSRFSGEYECRMLRADYVNLNMEYSIFKNGYSKDNGGAFYMSFSTIIINECAVMSNYSSKEGGSFYLYKNNELDVFGLDILNSTTFHNGDIFYIHNDSGTNISNQLKNISVRNIYKTYKSTGLGLVIFTSGEVQLNISNVICENIKCNEKASCLLFAYSGFTKVKMNNIEINNIEVYNGGGLFIHNSETNNLDVTNYVTNCVFNNINILCERDSSLLVWMEFNNYVFENCTIRNFNAKSSSITYAGFQGLISLNDITVENVHLEQSNGLFVSTINAAYNMENVNVNNAFLNGGILDLMHSNTVILNSSFNNIRSCNDSVGFECAIKQKLKYDYSEQSNTFIGFVRGSGKITIKKTSFKNFYGSTGFIGDGKSSITLSKVNIEESYFENGLYCIGNDLISKMKENISKFIVSGLIFKNNYSQSSTFLNIKKDDKICSSITVTDSIFENNMSSKYGGVIYSLNPIAYEMIKFENCNFKNNKAVIGNICFASNLEAEPYFSNKEKIIQSNDVGSFSTNPAVIKIENSENTHLAILSGEQISTKISFNLYDNYNSIIFFGSYINKMAIEDLILFKLEMNDTLNTKIIGQATNYCMDYSCILPNFRIVGKPGNYILKFIITAFGKYSKFENNTFPININIRKCDESLYKFQFRDDNQFESCYIPHCQPSCNKGICISDNLCDCSNTYLTGKNCNEYLKLERNYTLDMSIKIISFLLVLISMISIVTLYIYKNNYIIKGAGGRILLILILIGTILNYISAVIRLRDKNFGICISMNITRNLGFSFIFGSILFKTLKIYLAVFKIHSRVLTNKTMYLLIFISAFYHIIFDVVWDVFIGYKVLTKYNSVQREYHDCEETKFKDILLVTDIAIIASTYYLTYCIRSLQKEYKESLSMPIYIYMTSEIITTLLRKNMEKSPLMKEYFTSIFLILYSSIVVYNTFFTRFYIIHKNNSIYSQQLKQSEYNKNYQRQLRFDITESHNFM